MSLKLMLCAILRLDGVSLLGSLRAGNSAAQLSSMLCASRLLTVPFYHCFNQGI
jgi:hypothetical protein